MITLNIVLQTNTPLLFNELFKVRVGVQIIATRYRKNNYQNKLVDSLINKNVCSCIYFRL